MPDFRIHQSIAARADVGFNRRPNPLRRWRRIVSWCSFAAALLIVAALCIYNDKGVYWSGSASAGHRLFAKDCAKCHDQSFAPLQRLARLDNSIHSVTVSACTACHTDITVNDHSPLIAVHDLRAVENCAACHREHTGRESLAWVADRHCAQCHRDLDVTRKENSPIVVRQITSFAEHPEFAIKYHHHLQQKSANHAVWQVADKAFGGWYDLAQIRFNHWRHLNPEGLPLPPGDSDSGETVRQILACADCHMPDAQGKYMQPIRYEQHCQKCHKLQYSTRLAVGDGEARSLPHVAPDLLRGVLRDRLMKYATANPAAILNQDERAAERDDPRHPNKSRDDRRLTAKDKWAWVESMLSEMEAGVRIGTKASHPRDAFPARMMASKTISQVKYGCQHCHFVELSDAAENDLSPLDDWTVVPPNIPNRWLAYSRFDHSRHTQIACTGCHDPDRTKNLLPAPHDETHLESMSAGDILMPSIRICQRCHTKSAEQNLTPALNSRAPGHARADCVVCHDYHH